MTNDSRTNKITVYLLKEGLSDAKALKAYDRLKQYQSASGNLYYKDSEKHPPSWLATFFGPASAELQKDIFNASSKGVLIVPVPARPDRSCAICFGYGHMMLEPGAYEENFGLRVALNVIREDGLRRLDTKNVSASPRDSIQQLTKLGAVDEFFLDFEQDLVRSLVGQADEKFKEFGKTLCGKDSVSVSARFDVANIAKLIDLCWDRFTSQEYKSRFAWIDNVTAVRDTRLTNLLEQEAAKLIQTDQDDRVWMSVPELVNWPETAGFGYLESDSDSPHSDVDLTTFLKSHSLDRAAVVDLSFFRSKKVFCFSSHEGLRISWKALNCLYAEVEHKGMTYLLTSGTWYKIAGDFAQEIKDGFIRIRDEPTSIVLPPYVHKNEADYNEAAVSDGFLCLDRKNIVYGGKQSKIEFCDLLSPQKQLVHVKQYGSSSTLSHLFSQGTVATELFLSEPKFREAASKKFVGTSFDSIVGTGKPDAHEFEIVFAIISRSPKPLDIPFFSKVTLKNAVQRLRAFNVRVSLVKIQS